MVVYIGCRAWYQGDNAPATDTANEALIAKPWSSIEGRKSFSKNGTNIE